MSLSLFLRYHISDDCLLYILLWVFAPYLRNERTVHGSGALSCHYRKRTLKRQMTPEAVERRRKSGLSKLDDYNCPFKLAYSKLRFAKNQNSRKWKPRIFHIGTFAKKTCRPSAICNPSLTLFSPPNSHYATLDAIFFCSLKL